METQIWKAYLELGFDHILDLKGYDHILFVSVLTAIYTFKDWKKIVWLVTAFTVGHSITLALSSLNVISFNPDIIETLIPLTIIFTGLYQLYRAFTPKLLQTGIYVSYALTSVFGLIHGLGFSNYFKVILGKENSVLVPLFSFNAGVELGQLIVVTFSLMVGSTLVLWCKIPQKLWIVFLSLLCITVAAWLLIK
jgi:hypothetical protein